MSMLRASFQGGPLSIHEDAPRDIIPIDPCYNIQAEQALLSALLLNNQHLERLPDFFKAIHFADKRHQAIFEAIMHQFQQGCVADPITLRDQFLQHPLFIESANDNGAGYLVDLCTSFTSPVSVRDYATLIHELYLKRQLVDIGETMTAKARTPYAEESAKTQMEKAEKALYTLATEGEQSSGVVSFRESITKAVNLAEIAFKRDSHIVGVTTGLLDMDKYLGGLHPSDLIILAGRPSMGKTALATNIAFNAAMSKLKGETQGAPVVFFSLEMSSEQLATRLLASECGISSDKIRRGDLRADDFPKFVNASHRIADAPLFIDDTPALTVTALRNRARRLQRQHGLGLIVIDYLQLLDGGDSKSDNRVQEISQITRNLKALAKELNVPVLALSQLSRAVEQRDDKRPQLADLRESGSIEQDADVVMFVFREEYYEGRKEPTPGTDKHIEWQGRMEKLHKKAEVILAKQRHGPIGTVRLFFDGALTKFGNLTENYEDSF